MNTRRECLLGLSSFAVSAGAAHADLNYQVLKVGPRPKLIRGRPDKIDFGHGLLVPMSNDAFRTLWEGDDRWIAYGHAFGRRSMSAMAKAEDAAVGTMKLFLITLAFQPQRLMRVEGGGWRLKSNNVNDLIRGLIDLPGRPVIPAVDFYKDINKSENLFNWDSFDPPAHATTGYLVWKKDVTLDYVRRNAILAWG